MGQRAGFSRRAIAGIWLWASLLPIQAAGDSAAAPQPARTIEIEEVLRQAVRITWSHESHNPAVRHRLQRRARGADGQWSDWVDVSTGSGSDRPDHVIDAGSDGNGLAPGDYAYRVQRYDPGVGAQSTPSDWSTPTEFTMPPQCAGGDGAPGNEAPGSLTTVVIRDLDGDRRYTGDDVWLAMQRCSSLGGCVLEALPVTYDDVSIGLYGSGGAAGLCATWNPRICKPMPPFPKGLVIQGHGSASVFRSPVWRTPYKPAAIFEFWHAPGVQLRFRNFVLDGRKREQRDPTPGVNDWNAWRHRGIDVTHYFGADQSLRYPNGCVHNVTVRDFMGSGIEIDHARNWRIEYNRVHDIGCWKGLTECPGLTIPDTDPPPAWGCTGHQAPGYGIEIGNYTEDTQVAHNEIKRVTKYALGIKGGRKGTDPVTRLSVRDNRIANVGPVGIFLAGSIDGVIERNLVDGTHAHGCRHGWAWFSWGIQTSGTIRNTRIRENTLRNLAGIAIGSNAVADGLVFLDNRIDNVCVERNAKVGSAQAAIQFGDLSSGGFTLSGNSVTGNHCSMALAVGLGSRAQVVVDGGYYSIAENSDADHGAVHVESGNSHSPRVLLKGGVIVDYLGSQRRPGIIASGNGRIVVQDDSVVVKGFRKPFDTVRSCMDGCATKKSGVIVQCASSPSSPECR